MGMSYWIFENQPQGSGNDPYRALVVVQPQWPIRTTEDGVDIELHTRHRIVYQDTPTGQDGGYVLQLRRNGDGSFTGDMFKIGDKGERLYAGHVERFERVDDPEKFSSVPLRRPGP